VRKYIADAKTAEARNSIGMIANLAAASYERDGKLCPSASAPVPANPSFISARKYQSTPDDWNADAARNVGFACLKFEMSWPQYYQYDYHASADSFAVVARGDLDGDGVFSEWTIRGKVTDGHVVISPTIEQTDPFE
jgi:type IV pilus assembly protein PilA